VPLHCDGQVVPHLFRSVRAVQQKCRTLGSRIQDVVFLDEGKLMTSHEVGLLYHVSRSDGLGAEAEMRYGDASRLLRVVDEIALGVEVRAFAYDLDAVLVGADRAVSPKSEEYRLGEVWVRYRKGSVQFEARLRHVVVDAHGEVVFGRRLGGFIQDGLDHSWRELFRR